MSNITPTSFTLLVTKSPFDYRNAHSAISFCIAALNQGHSISQVFFYQTGVHNASCLLRPHSDDLHVYDKWCDLANNHGVILNVCVTAASRRGILDTELAPQHERANLIHPFVQVGLSWYFKSLQDNSVNIQL